MAEMESLWYAQASTENESEVDQEDQISLRFLGGIREFSSRFDLQSSRTTSRPVRELYPRLGWHDVHTKIVGIPARDVSSHFIQVGALSSLSLIISPLPLSLFHLPVLRDGTITELPKGKQTR
jgi:phosphatidylserine/phosphatidylglycerophosphate/cardiolipin synthase-like enzyme